MNFDDVRNVASFSEIYVKEFKFVHSVGLCSQEYELMIKGWPDINAAFH